ncbi:InlB B-repeat-containing protein [Paenibacillus glycanilyticus]|uniref:InlB B-repeat-containing protein n=1 Tax=Paenibacillus glycanilyticus TaxID=126569 RepID=UPI00295E2C4F|nr:InlB B-repeat-containing protein [Paenibacillus glycanilyticus]
MKQAHAAASTGSIYYTESNSPYWDAKFANLADGSGVTKFYDSATGTPQGIAVDPINKKLYYSDPHTSVGKIYKSELDGSNAVVLLAGVNANSIALDLIHNKMYFTEAYGSHFQVSMANIDGTNVQVIYTSATGTPKGIAVDPEGGFLYYSDAHSTVAKIFRSNLDGSDAIVFKSGVNAYNLALDKLHGKIYYAESNSPNFQVSVANLSDGSNAQVIYTSATGTPQSVAVDPVGGYVYYGDSHNTVAKIFRANLDGSNPTVFMTDVRANSIALYIEPPKYKVAYDANGSTSGTAPFDSNSYLQGDSVNVLANTGNLARTGYTFDGWSTGSGTSYAPGSSFNMGTADVTLFAKWTINSYAVTFNSNGGSAVNDQTVNYNGTVSEPTDPTKTGYTFGGWYSDSKLDNKYVFTTPVTGDITLYAKWTLNAYTVTFNSNSGSAVSPQTVNHGEAADKPADPTRTGYTFGGWYSDSGLENAYIFTTQVTGNMTLYAKWTINSYSITFNSNGGSGVNGQTVNYNGTVSEPTDPTKTGYTFGGWYTDSNLDNKYVFATPVTGDITLYAKWTLNAYTVTFNSNSGSAVSPQTVNHGQAADKPADPTRTGYTFGGWYSDSGLKNAYIFTTQVTGNMTLYAKWTINSYSITFNSNGGSGVNDQTVNYNGTVSEPTDPTKTGYTFGGWYTDSNLDNKYVFATPVTGDVTLYAKFTLVPLLTNVTLTSSNLADAYAKVGDTVTLSFKANKPLNGLPVVKIAGHTVTASLMSDNRFEATYTFTDTDTEGTTAFTIDFADQEGLTGSQVTATTDNSSVFFDQTAPTGALAINGGNAITNSSTVNLSITAADGAGSGHINMRFSNDALTWSTWEPVSASKAWTLAEGNGSKNVYMQLQDAAGNLIATPLSAAIELKIFVSPPSQTVSAINVNGQIIDPSKWDTSKPSVSITVTPNGDGSAFVSIPASILTTLYGKNSNFIIEIKAPYGSYQVPVNLASLIPNLNGLLTANNLKAEDVGFKITLTDKSSSQEILNAFKKSLPNGAVLGSIVDFHIDVVNTKIGTAIGGANQFSQAITRTIPMPKALTEMPAGWGAYRYNEQTKKFEFVPAKKEKIDGVWYVMISSYSNSIYAVVQNSVSFTDMSKHWAQPVVQLAAVKGLVQGIGNGKFDPNRSVTRAEFTAMLMRALGRGAIASSAAPFEDVQSGKWYSAEVTAAKELGLLDFVTGSRFMPDQALTREEMASMLAAVVELEQFKVDSKSIDLNHYKDINNINPVYLEDVKLVVQLQIMTGTGTKFAPKDATTRAEAAAVLIRTLQALGMIDK